jgi:hypothetical protein
MSPDQAAGRRHMDAKRRFCVLGKRLEKQKSRRA